MTPPTSGAADAGAGAGANDPHQIHMSPTIAGDIAALIHAIQGGNANAVDAAVAALETAMRAGGGAAADAAGAAAGAHGPDIDGAASFAQGHHFEHVWG